MRPSPARAAAVAVVLASVALPGCAGPGPDAQAWAQATYAAVADAPDVLAGGTLAVGASGEEDAATSTFEWDEGASLVQADARCTGGGTASVTVEVRFAGGTRTEGVTAPVACDESPHPVLPEATEWVDVTAVEVRASGARPTAAVIVLRAPRP